MVVTCDLCEGTESVVHSDTNCSQQHSNCFMRKYDVERQGYEQKYVRKANEMNSSSNVMLGSLRTAQTHSVKKRMMFEPPTIKEKNKRKLHIPS